MGEHDHRRHPRPDQLGLFTAQEWARWTAVFFVTLNAVSQVGIFTVAPIWALIVILLDVIIIYNLTVRASEPI
jgi:hypothetical protein